MPCELLVQAMTKHDWRRGCIISARDTPVTWGRMEQPPWRVIVRLLDATRAQVEQFMGNWRNEFTHDIMAENASGYRIRVHVPSKMAEALGDRALNRTVLRSYLEIRWGISFVSSDPTQIIFDIPKPVSLQALKEDLKDKFEEQLGLWRYRFPDTDIDLALLNPGGVLELTRAAAQLRLIDRAA